MRSTTRRLVVLPLLLCLMSCAPVPPVVKIETVRLEPPEELLVIDPEPTVPPDAGSANVAGYIVQLKGYADACVARMHGIIRYNEETK